MGAQENIELVRRGYAAFSAGDMATLHELFADDAVWYVPGSGPLSGAKQGRDAIMAYFGELATRTGGEMKATLRDVVGGDEHTVSLDTSEASREAKSLKEDGVVVFTIRDGRVTEARQFFEDTARSDEFWA